MLVSFAKMDQMNIMFALFLLLVVTVYTNPSMVKKLNHTILGRLIIVAIIVYFSVHNTTAGILATLVIICAMQKYIYQEGFDDATTSATNADSAATKNVGADSLEQDSNIDKSKVDDLKKKIEATTDQITSQEQIQSVNSNSLPTPPPSGNDNEVTPSGKETFQTLGFSAY